MREKHFVEKRTGKRGAYVEGMRRPSFYADIEDDLRFFDGSNLSEGNLIELL